MQQWDIHFIIIEILVKYKPEIGSSSKLMVMLPKTYNAYESVFNLHMIFIKFINVNYKSTICGEKVADFVMRIISA